MIDPRTSNAPILGRYQALSDLAKSRIGGLVLAVDVPERCAVALRSFPVEARMDIESGERLLEVGRWVKRLEDPAVMMPLELGTQEGVMHAAYRYTVSEPLRAVQRLTAFKGRAFPVGVALRIAHDVTLAARALEACGAPPSVGEPLCGALLPDSILVGADGMTRLCDAGIASILRRERSIFEHVDVLGYAAPEQMDTRGPVDGRSDVFSIGVLLWEMLANRHLFSSHELSEKPRSFAAPTLESVSRGAADPIPTVVVQLVKRALCPTPSERYPGSTALLQAIESHCGGVLAPPEAVGAFMAEYFENIFESRRRSIESAVAVLESGTRESFSAPPPSAAAARQASLRAAATKKQAASEGVNELRLSVPSSAGKPDDATSDTAASADAAPDIMRGPTASGTPTRAEGGNVSAPGDSMSPTQPTAGHLPSVPPPPVRKRSSWPASPRSSKPPILPEIRALPQQFELPGAELFETPGLPLARPKGARSNIPGDKSLELAGEPSVAEARVPPAKASTEVLGGHNDSSNVNSVGPTVPTPPNFESEPGPTRMSAAPHAELTSALPDGNTQGSQVDAPLRRRRFQVTWFAVLSIVAVAFISGVAARRCSRQNVLTTPSRVAAAIVSASGAAASAQAAASERPEATLGSASAAGDVVADAGAALAAGISLDASSPPTAVSAVARVQASKKVQPATKGPAHRSAAKSNSKIVRGPGKVIR